MGAWGRMKTFWIRLGCLEEAGDRHESRHLLQRLAFAEGCHRGPLILTEKQMRKSDQIRMVSGRDTIMDTRRERRDFGREKRQRRKFGRVREKAGSEMACHSGLDDSLWRSSSLSKNSLEYGIPQGPRSNGPYTFPVRT